MQHLEIDRPHLRARSTCIRCGSRKDVGLVLCWNCHRALKAEHDGSYGIAAERILADAETQLAQLAAKETHRV